MAFLIFFAIGVVEMFIVTAWTRIVVGSHVLMSGAVTMVSVLIWYYVIDAIVSNAMTLPVVLTYTVGCAIGAMIGTYYVGKPKRNETISVIEHEPAPVV